MKNYTWKTQAGAAIKMAVSQSRIIENEVDGYKYETTENEMKLENFEANGKAYEAYISTSDDRIHFIMNNKNFECIIPDDVWDEITAPKEARDAKATKFENEWEDYEQGITNAMNQ